MHTPVFALLIGLILVAAVLSILQQDANFGGILSAWNMRRRKRNAHLNAHLRSS
jgi:hypothetical protein